MVHDKGQSISTQLLHFHHCPSKLTVTAAESFDLGVNADPIHSHEIQKVHLKFCLFIFQTIWVIAISLNLCFDLNK